MKTLFLSTVLFLQVGGCSGNDDKEFSSHNITLILIQKGFMWYNGVGVDYPRQKL